MNPMKQLSPKEWQLLSAYLDDQVSPRERIQIEKKLARDDAFNQALISLRQTRAVIRCMPQRRVPRNFTLTPEMVPARHAPRLIPVLRFASAFSAVAAVILFALQLLPGLMGAGAPMAAPAAMEMAAGSQATGSTPPVIYWGGPPAQVQNFAGGMGGGGGSDEPYAMPSNGIQFDIPQATGEPGVGAAAVPMPEATPSGESAPAFGATLPPSLATAPKIIPSVEPTATVPAEVESQRSAEPLAGNPVLGLRPEDSGQVISKSQPETGEQNRAAYTDTDTVMLWAAIGLAALAILSALLTWILWKKSRI